MATGLERETWGAAPGCDRPRERARAACAEPGPTRELTDGVPERDVPLKADGTGLLLPLPPPGCRLRTPAAAMAAWTCAEWTGEGLGLRPGVEQFGIAGVDDPGARDGGPEGV